MHQEEHHERHQRHVGLHLGEGGVLHGEVHEEHLAPYDDELPPEPLGLVPAGEPPEPPVVPLRGLRAPRRLPVPEQHEGEDCRDAKAIHEQADGSVREDRLVGVVHPQNLRVSTHHLDVVLVTVQYLEALLQQRGVHHRQKGGVAIDRPVHQLPHSHVGGVPQAPLSLVQYEYEDIDGKDDDGKEHVEVPAPEEPVDALVTVGDALGPHHIHLEHRNAQVTDDATRVEHVWPRQRERPHDCEDLDLPQQHIGRIEGGGGDVVEDHPHHHHGDEDHGRPRLEVVRALPALVHEAVVPVRALRAEPPLVPVVAHPPLQAHALHRALPHRGPVWGASVGIEAGGHERRAGDVGTSPVLGRWNRLLALPAEVPFLAGVALSRGAGDVGSRVGCRVAVREAPFLAHRARGHGWGAPEGGRHLNGNIARGEVERHVLQQTDREAARELRHHCH
mmetsp:Transcript_32053/g.102086  ORF Transcript_32053/g.102086 Transcript_32053/m.102086 type:complete len:447 (-) Transcript_32053:934-2274(-)